MININLLPEAMRKKESMPLPHFLGIVGALALFGLLLFLLTKYEFDIIPDLQSRKASLQSQRAKLLVQADELKKINAEIARLTEHVDAVKTLYRQRVVWSRILSDLKRIVNFDTSMSEYNADMRYLWFTKLSAKGKAITLNGFATAANQVVAIQMPEKLLQGFLSYVPVALPEKDEEAILETERKSVAAEYEALRRENPDLPLLGPKEQTIAQRLEEIKAIKSGGIALQPFAKFLVPGSLRLINATWSNAPRPKGTAAELTEVFPREAWSFGISMSLK